MKTLIPILIFFTCSAAGFFIGSTIYAAALGFGIIDPDNSLAGATILMTWLICTAFSFSSFFFSGRWKIFFLSMPIIMTLIVALAILVPTL